MSVRIRHENLYRAIRTGFRSMEGRGYFPQMFLPRNNILHPQREVIVPAARLAIAGYVCGSILGTLICLISIGLPCFRYGIDSVDTSKSFLGVRGAVAATCGVLVMTLGWAAVVMAMRMASAAVASTRAWIA